MVQTSNLKNVPGNWSAQKKYRVTDVAFDGINYYSNISGINSALSNTANWFKISNNALNPIEVDKTAADVAASGADFVIDLSTAGLPALPVVFVVYIDLLGDGHPLPVSPPQYNPITKILSGMNDPATYAAQTIKIFVQ